MAITQQRATGFETANVKKYDHRRLDPAEFRKLRRDAGVSPRDFMYFTGRHSAQLAIYEGELEADPKRAAAPIMAEVLLLEIIKRYPDMHDIATGICNEYSLGARPEPERKGA